jgi:hypothetical protein
MITTRAALVTARTSINLPGFVSKNATATMTVGQYASSWRANGTPTLGAIPGAYAVPTTLTTGALVDFEAPGGSKGTYVAEMRILPGTAGTGIELHDRLAHMGGLSGTSVALQTVAVDVNVATSNMVARRGASNFSQVQWWLEWYTTTGATPQNASIGVTYDNGTTDTIVVAIPASQAQARLLPILPNTAGRYIRTVDDLTLAGSTGTAGSFGVTATRQLTGLMAPNVYEAPKRDWSYLGFPRVEDEACLQFLYTAVSANTGNVVGFIKLVQG